MSDVQTVKSWLPAIEKGDAIAILWHINDVIDFAAHKDVNLSEDQAREVLANVRRSHDAEIGISWDVIDIHIDMFFADLDDA
jgi:hypothetical protein